MAREVRAWLCAMMALGAVVGAVSAQPQDLPPPIQVDVYTAAPAPMVEVPVAGPASSDPWDMLAPTVNPASAPPADVPYEDRNGMLLVGDPFLDPGRFPAPGWFGAVQGTLLSPFYHNRLTGPVAVPGVGTMLVRVPTADFNWTVSPEFSLGYRFGQGGGSIVFSYRFLMDQGTAGAPATLSTGDTKTLGLLGLPTPATPALAVGGGNVTSRLNVNVIGLDYRSREYGLGPKWDMRWSAGAWIVTNYFDSTVQGTTLLERASNNTVAAGPHIACELWRWLSPQAGHGLGLYSKTDAAIVTGRVDQNFETIILGPGGVPVAGGAAKLTADPFAVAGNGSSQFMPIMRVQFGFTWAPEWGHDRLRFTGGYEFDGWWWVGRLPGPTGNSFTLGSQGTMTNNGIFFRAGWRF